MEIVLKIGSLPEALVIINPSFAQKFYREGYDNLDKSRFVKLLLFLLENLVLCCSYNK